MHVAHTPTLDSLKAAGPRRYRLLKAHGMAVGLPSDADMGNSEVGAGLDGWCSRGCGCGVRWVGRMPEGLHTSLHHADSAGRQPGSQGSPVGRSPPDLLHLTCVRVSPAAKAFILRLPCMTKILHRLPIPGPDSSSLQVGHNALGAGQIVDQGAKCVDKALATGGELKPLGQGREQRRQQPGRWCGWPDGCTRLPHFSKCPRAW